MSKLSVAVALKVTMIFGLSLAGAVAIASPPKAAMSCTASRFDKAASLTQAARAIVCDAANRRLLIVGDYHGSNEIPDFVAQLVSDASAQRPVKLGLEMETFEKKPIQAYMASHGTAADRAALLHDGFWAVGQGRMSQAIVRLIESVRKLREQGRDVDVFTTVTDYPGDAAIKQAGGDDAYRSTAMAQIIHGEVQQGAADQLVIAFMGNAHSAFTGPARGKDATVTERLLADAPYLVNLDLHGGSAWNCQSDGCGEHKLTGKAMPVDGSSLLRKAQGQSGEPTQVWLQFPPMTPSPPAKEKTPKA
ncbi:MAG TPA: hypothetical protein VN731_07000 [Rhodanobacter sp.]|nr:hypothetical protein [Rhodanobacter sp.]